MTYKELIQEVWNIHIKPQNERKKYIIKNDVFSPQDNTKEENWGLGVQAEWEAFGVAMFRAGGWLEVIDYEYEMGYGEDSIDDLIIFAYSDLKKPLPLSHKMIESESWEIIEVKG